MLRKKIGIAIDGPSGSGKSTLAKNIARRLGMIYVDTGSLYRAVGLFVRDRGAASDDAASIIALLPEIKLTMRLVDGGGKVCLGGKTLGDEIRTPEISKYASDVSKLPEVRDFLFETQRSIARKNDVVMDGRDIGTVILPKAQVKLFVTASDEERARRRYAELIGRGEEVTYESVLADMRARDENDRSRDIAPCVPAKDAVVLDNTFLDVEQTVDAALEIILDKLKGRISVK